MATTLVTSTNGTINIKGDHDWFKANLEANTLYSVSVSGLKGLSSSGLSLYDSNGLPNNLVPPSYSLTFTFMGETTQTYFIDLGSFYSNSVTGNYTLSLAKSPDDYWNNKLTSGVINVGSSANGTTNISDDHDWFKVSLNANTLYAITSTTPNSPLSLGIIDANGVAVDHLDAQGVTNLGFMPSTSGIYYIDAASSSVGDYSIHVAVSPDDYRNNTSTTGVVTVGGSASGLINIANEHDWFKVELSANTLYGFTSSALTGTYSYINVYDSNGVLFSELWSSTNSPLGFMTETSGTYYLDVSSDKTGSYSLNVAISPDDYRDNTTTTGTVAVGGTVNGTINLTGEHDWIKVNLAANNLYTISTTGLSSPYGFSNAYLMIFDANGTEVSSTDAYGWGGKLGYMPVTTGTYFIDISSLDSLSANNTYSLSLSLSQDDYRNNISTTGAITVGGTATGTINTSGDHDWFKISLSADTLYSINTTGLDSSGTSMSILEIFDATGHPLPALDAVGGGQLAFMPSSTGIYYVDVGGSDVASIGSYTLHVSASQDDYLNNARTTGILNTGVPNSPTDTTPPTISNFSPADGTTNAAISSNIVLTFNEAIQRGIGNIAIKTASGSALESYDAATSNNITITGSTLTINPTTDLAYSTQYHVEFSAGTIKDLAGNGFGGTNSYGFTTGNNPQIINGTDGRDNLSGTSNNDSINGGANTDTANYSQRQANYSIEKTGNGLLTNGPEGLDTLISIERLNFADTHLAFDTDGSAGQVYRLYKSAFARTPDLTGLGSWIDAMDNGQTLDQVSSAFIGSGEFQNLYGSSTSNADFIKLLYLNVLGRAPDSGLSYWVDQIASGTKTRAQVLSQFSESTENKSAVQNSIKDGILYATADQATIATHGLTLNATTGADTLFGSVAKDILSGLAGNDVINGGAGIDTSVYDGLRSGYTITRSATGLTIQGGTEGSDTLVNVERLKFSDGGLAFDVNGNAGQVYRLYQAAFDRTPDVAGLSDWIRGMDGGMTLRNVATGFIGSGEFQGKYGANPSNDAFITLLYQNVLNRAPDDGGKAYWMDELSRGLTKEMALIGFSESAENQAAVIGVIQDGIPFIPG